MKTYTLPWLLGTLLMVSTAVWAQKPAKVLQHNARYENNPSLIDLNGHKAYKGVVRVKFKNQPEVVAKLDQLIRTRANNKGEISRFGAEKAVSVEGLEGLNARNVSYGAQFMKRIFRPAGKFEEKHREWGLHLWYEITVNDKSKLQTVLADYASVGEIELAEARYEMKLHTLAGPPNDPQYSTQANHYDLINTLQAWGVETGSSDVVVAIEDQGVDYTHPDLAGHMWTNPGEVPNNGVDDDNNGYVDDYYGWNFGNNNSNIAIDYHGTHVGGTVSAETNNGVGVAGVAGGSGNNDGVRLMTLSVFGNNAQGGFDEAFIYAADNGAAISQNSWGGGAQNTALENAIDYFIANGGGNVMNGGLVVFAAGNDNSSSPSVGYPGSYSPVIAVSSTTYNATKSSFSNYGSWVDIAAPGSNILSTYPVSQGSYNTISGTSMACPHVSGVAALVVSYNHRNGTTLTSAGLRNILESTANSSLLYDANPSFSGQLGVGMVDAYAAITGQVAPPPPPPTCSADYSLDVTLNLTTDNYGSETSWSVKDNISGSTVASGSGYANNTTYNITINGLAAGGNYTFTINDTYGDGICCQYGNGSYALVDGAGATIASGGNFGSAASTNFCIGSGTTPVNNAPVANAGGPYSGTEGQAVSFNGSGSSDADGDALTYSWSFGDGATGTGVSPSHTYAAAGSYTVTLTVSDGTDSDQALTTVTVQPAPNNVPVANAGGPYSGTEGQAIAFSGSGSDADGDALTYSWNFGDGSTATGANVFHTYAAAGTYTATLTVSDGQDTASDTATVTVEAANSGGNCYTTVSLTLVTDRYGSETSWSVTNASGAAVASGSGYGNSSTYTETFSLAAGDYTFTITDSYGDGICCQYGNGSYTLNGDGTSFATGGNFGSSESVTFCVGGNGGGTDPGTGTPPTGYCDASGNNSTYEWIDLVSIGNINNTSGNDGGYADNTSLSTDISQGSSQTIQFSAGFSGTSYREYWGVYIDYNRDGDFDDAGEQVVSGNSTSAGTLQGTFTVPSGASLGATRLRVVMKYNSAAAPCGSFSYGEVEDYLVNIVGAGVASVNSPKNAGETIKDEFVIGSDFKAYPNPARIMVKLHANLEASSLVRILNIQGAEVMRLSAEDAQRGINISALDAGVYIINASNGRENLTTKFIKN